jgi:hypothetical protein
MRIDSSGRVGIGTTSPNYQLEVRTTTNNRAIQAVNSTTSGTNWGFQGGAYGVGAAKNIGLQITAEGASTNYAALFTGGNVGIGTDSPNAKLTVFNTEADTSINVNTGTGGSYPKKTGISFGATSTSYGSAPFTGGAGIQAINTAASGNPTDLTFWTNSVGTPAERMRIDSNGVLTVGGQTSTRLVTTITENDKVDLKVIDGTASGRNFTFSTGNTERMRITSGGRVYINSNAYSRDAFTMMEGDSTTYVLGLDAPAQYAGLYRYQTFFSGANISGTITGSNQTSISYNTSSDYRMKKNIKPLQNGLERLSKLKPVKFDWKLNDESTEGFIAHEVQEIFPDAISGEKDGEDMQGMDYGRITPLLVAAIQELKAEVELLKTQINN